MRKATWALRAAGTRVGTVCAGGKEDDSVFMLLPAPVLTGWRQLRKSRNKLSGSPFSVPSGSLLAKGLPVE